MTLKFFSIGSFAAVLSTTFAVTDTAAQVTNFPDDVNISGDLYVEQDSTLDGRVCVGNTCSISESYNNDVAMRFRYTQQKIEFQDTSGNSNPDRDWAIRINDNDAGGLEKFAIEDTTQGTTPFTIEGGAPNNSLFVSSAGRLGVGTTLPSEELHLIESVPAIRFEDNVGTPRSWDLGGSSISFFLTDVTNQTTPFGVVGGSPNNSLVVDNTGNVGLGTASPAAPLHIQRSDNTASLLIEDTSAGTLGQMTLRNNGITFFTLEDTSIAAGPNSGRSWNFQNQAGTFRVTTAPAGAEMLLTATGDMTISGTLTTAGSCSAGCDRVFDADYPLPSIAEHNAEMWANGHLPNVGPTAEEGPFNVSDKMGRMLNELEHAHIFIGQLHKDAQQKSDEIAALKAEISALKSLVLAED